MAILICIAARDSRTARGDGQNDEALEGADEMFQGYFPDSSAGQEYESN